MRISLYEKTRRATSIMRRGNLFLFLSSFLLFRSRRLKVKHANIVTK